MIAILHVLGVSTITVSLMFMSADVYYDQSVLRASEIAEIITDLGYPCEVVADSQSNSNKHTFWARITQTAVFFAILGGILDYRNDMLFVREEDRVEYNVADGRRVMRSLAANRHSCNRVFAIDYWPACNNRKD